MTVLSKPAADIGWPRLVIADGALEALKWFAAALMLVDHINKYLLDAAQPWMFWLGRLAMPIFAIVLGYNLARSGARERGVIARTAWRLAACAVVSSIPFIALGKTWAGGWWPVNILATLLVSVLVLQLWHVERRGARVLAVLLFIAGGALGEFFWLGAAIVLASYAYCRAPTTTAGVLLVASVASLALVNGNHWALASLGVVAMASHASCLGLALQVPRSPFAFYVFYPAHLAALFAVRHMFF